MRLSRYRRPVRNGRIHIIRILFRDFGVTGADFPEKTLQFRSLRFPFSYAIISTVIFMQRGRYDLLPQAGLRVV